MKALPIKPHSRIKGAWLWLNPWHIWERWECEYDISAKEALIRGYTHFTKQRRQPTQEPTP